MPLQQFRGRDTLASRIIRVANDKHVELVDGRPEILHRQRNDVVTGLLPAMAMLVISERWHANTAPLSQPR
jgi:hypothetical protein